MNIITETAKKFGFPAEAVDYLGETFQSIAAAEGVMDKFYAAMDILYCGTDASFTDLLQEVADSTGVNRYTVDMIFLLWSAKPLEYMYHLNGLPEQMYLDSMNDLRWKVIECKKMYNVWGTFVTGWFPGFYRLQRYTFGRLEFDVSTATEAYKDVLQPGDLQLNCHIPSSGPLTEESVRESLLAARRFFQEKGMLRNNTLVVACGSWLLYPPLLEQLGDHTNMKKFYRLFDIVKSTPSQDNSSFWRVFYVPYSEEALDTVPTNTTLEKTIVSFLKSGGSLGSGSGYIVVDENY